MEPLTGTEAYAVRTLNEYLIQTPAGRWLMEMDPTGPADDGPEFGQVSAGRAGLHRAGYRFLFCSFNPWRARATKS